MNVAHWFNRHEVRIACLTGMMLLGGADVVLAAGGKGWLITDTARVMNFAVLAVALFLVLRKPVSQALNGRISGIRKELDDLEAKKVEAEKKLAEYDERIRALEQEAEKIVAEYVKQGEDAKQRILNESKKAADKLEEQARKNIEHEFQNVKNQLQGEILEKALAKAEEIVKSSISDDDQNRLVDEYLEKVVAQ